MNFSDILFPSILAGLAGTGGMTLLLHGITRSGISDARMILALGSLVTRRREGAQSVGWAIHLISGSIFGVIYGAVISRIVSYGPGAAIGTGVLLGFLHGVVVSIGLIVAVAEQHPLPEFREAPLGVALAHAAGHIVYGLVVGLVLAFALNAVG